MSDKLVRLIDNPGRAVCSKCNGSGDRQEFRTLTPGKYCSLCDGMGDISVTNAKSYIEKNSS